jgi:hypothetical protein
MNDNIKMDAKISKMGQRAPDSSGSWQEWVADFVEWDKNVEFD